MRHEWIFDVLTDLRIYAQKNGLVAITAETDRLLDVARKELTEKTVAEQSPPAQSPSGEDSSAR